MTTANINLWSKTASSNASADPSTPWPEGMLPAQVNDSSRGLMQGEANDRDDTRGQLTTAGTSTAYTLTTNSVNTTYQDGLSVGFVFHTATGTAPTLNVDSIGAKPIYKVGSSGPVALAANDYVQDAHLIVQYDASLNGAAGAWVCMTPLSASAAGGGATQTYFIGGTSTNSTNAYTLASLSGFTQTQGYTLSFKPSAANTGASTLAITSPSLSATNIFKSGASGPIALVGGELQTNQTAVLLYDGTRYLLQNPSAGTASLLDTGTAAGQVVKLDGSAKLPAVDGSQLTNLTALTGVLVNIQFLTASSGTYTPTSGATKGRAILIGGGGGGGGAGSTAGTSAAGGGYGAITEAYLSSLSSTSYTNGAAGAAGAGTGTTGTVGGNGGQTSFGSITAPGGTGGTRAGSSVAKTTGGAGGVPGTGGTFNIPGAPGFDNYGNAFSGAGANGQYGAGGQSVGASTAGNPGTGYGAGGSGGSATSSAGGAGTAGAIIIYEYK